MKLESLHNNMPTFQQLLKLRPDIASEVQAIYNDWDGHGGICDEIASKIIETITSNFDVDVDIGGHEGDDHAFVIIRDDSGNAVYGIDIPYDIYERGGGYNWQKLEGVDFKPEDVVIWRY